MNVKHQNASELLMMNLERIHEDIRFADQKAGFVAVLNSGMLALLWNLKSDVRLIQFAIYSGVFLLICAIVLTCVVVVPRGHRFNMKRGKGLVDGARIAKYEKDGSDGFVADLNKSDAISVVHELQELTFDFSMIHSRKYRFILAAVWMTCFAMFVSMLALLALRFHPGEEVPVRESDVPNLNSDVHGRGMR